MDDELVTDPVGRPVAPDAVESAVPTAAAVVSAGGPNRSRGVSLAVTILVAAVVAGVVGLFAGLSGYLVGRSVDGVAADSVSSGPSSTSAGAAAGTISQIAQRTLPAVVSILVEGQGESGTGSGFVLRPEGYLLTNNHVASVAGSDGTITVVFNDGTRADATVVGTNPQYDLAVLKVDRTGLPTLAVGNSDDVVVGDLAIAIGAPLGLDGTVTSGIVSAVDRPVTAGDSGEEVTFINAIQTDAAINPGNSGGPLLDAHGAVIGVTSAIASLAGGSEVGNIGLGFAIPVNEARRIAEEIIATGTSHTPLMGVKLDMDYADGGARVTSVTAGSPADDAGIEPGDVITDVDGRRIDDGVELVVEVRSHAPGDEITVTYTRDGDERTATVVLTELTAS